MSKLLTPYKQCKKVGRCAIFYHTNVKDKNPLSGTTKDEERVKIASSNLGFEVESFKNIRGRPFMRKLTDYAKMNYNDYSCFLLVITTHEGCGDVLLTSEGAQHKLSDILELFKQEKCPSLKGKPKIFIIDACRGKKELLKWTSKRQATNFLKDRTKVLTIPLEEHFLVAHATYPEYKAYDRQTGSIFIENVCKALQQQHFRDVTEALTWVNNETTSQGRQMPSFTSTLTKLLKLAHSQLTLEETRPNKGCMLIFGTEDDKKYLEAEGENLQLEIINKSTHQQITFAQMKAYAGEDFDKYDLFVCVINTKSSIRDELLDSEDKPYSLHDFVQCFDGDKCPGLNGKPKIFIIQAPQQQTAKGQETNPSGKSYKIPETADTIIVYSEETATKRTNFIKTFFDHLKKYKDETDFLGILLLLKKTLRKRPMPTVTSQLRKRVYFGEKTQTD